MPDWVKILGSLLFIFLGLCCFMYTLHNEEIADCQHYYVITGVHTSMIDGFCYAEDGDHWTNLIKFKDTHGYPIKH